ncbi:MAG: hypothetical protein IJB55_07005 [Firmicutes bacterium]|nr:hypothetical protein [Bacillota bacterium]
MEAVIDNNFVVEALHERKLSGEDSFRFSYDWEEYPELYHYLSNKWHDKEAILYRDKLQECTLHIVSVSITMRLQPLGDITEDDAIMLRRETSGDIWQNLPFSERGKFPLTHSRAKFLPGQTHCTLGVKACENADNTIQQNL